MVKCSVCGKEVEEPFVTLTIEGETHHLCSEDCLGDFKPINRLTRRKLSSVVLSKTSGELVAIGTSLGGIAYTLQDIAFRALVMDTLSAIAAIAAFIVGVEHLRYLREHDLMRRAVLLLGIGIIMTIGVIVWHFGFRSNGI